MEIFWDDCRGRQKLVFFKLGLGATFNFFLCYGSVCVCVCVCVLFVAEISYKIVFF